MNNQLRWNSYVLLKGKELSHFWKSHFEIPEKKVLYILGKGFDVRMNLGIEGLLSAYPDVDITCLLIEFDEGENSPSIAYQKYVDENIDQLKELLFKIQDKKIKLWEGAGRKRRRIGDREAVKIINDYSEIENYSDIIVDVSALPRGIYFSLIGKLLALYDHNSTQNGNKQNLFILTSENAKLDSNIREEGIDEDINYTHGFTGGLEASIQNPIIWFPILGENKLHHISKAYNKINPDEICPLLPFPAKDPRRSDNLIGQYRQLLFDELRIEPQNIMYAPEQNPFEVYRNLSLAIKNYYKSLATIGGCKVVISTFSSKLLSIGALMVAYELNQLTTNPVDVGVLNVDSQGYQIENAKILKKYKEETEVFVTWLTGMPYN